MSDTALITDFTVGLYNKSITEGSMINLLKKVGKSNGFKVYSFIVPSKYLKYIKCNYMSETACKEDLDDFYKELYKESVMVFMPQDK